MGRSGGIMIDQFAKRERFLLQLLFGLMLTIAIWMTAANLSNPLTGSYSFRQTQTALSAYWIAKGGPWIDYETPVLGAPWSIPFEFPLYQLLVAAVSHLGIPLDSAGRLVSFAFFLGCLWPIRMLVRSVDLSELSFWRVAILFISSPLYVFWSGSFMIESCALFFSLLWLAYFSLFIKSRHTSFIFLAAGFGALAALVKITTFLSFALLGGLVVFAVILRDVRRRMSFQDTVPVVLAFAFIGFIPFFAGLLWTWHAEHIRMANELAANSLSQAHLQVWIFGTLQQRLDAAQWYGALAKRTFPHTLGYLWPLAIAVLCVGILRKPLLSLAACAGFLSLFLLFTKLAFVHDYYPYATSVFLLIAVAIGLGSIQVKKFPMAGFCLLALLAVNQVAYSALKYFPIDDFVRFDTSSELQAAEFVKSRTKPGTSVLVFGEDWSSILQYLSERKGLSVWDGAISAARFDELLASPQQFLADAPLGAIVICRGVSADPTRKAKIEKFAAERSTIGSFGACRVVEPEKKAADNKL